MSEHATGRESLTEARVEAIVTRWRDRWWERLRSNYRGEEDGNGNPLILLDDALDAVQGACLDDAAPFLRARCEQLERERDERLALKGRMWQMEYDRAEAAERRVAALEAALRAIVDNRIGDDDDQDAATSRSRYEMREIARAALEGSQ